MNTERLNLPAWPAEGLFVRALLLGLCLPFVVSGIGKLVDLDAAVAEMQQFRLPWPTATAFATIALQLGASWALVFRTGGVAAVAALALAGFTIAATLIAHAFWAFDGAERALHLRVFVEHMALACAFVLVAGWQLRRRAPG